MGETGTPLGRASRRSSVTSPVDVLRPSDKRELPLASFQRERRREDNGRKELRAWLVIDSWRPSGLGEHMLTLAEELRDRVSISLAAPALRGGHDLLDQAREAGLCVAPLRGRTEAAPALTFALGCAKALLMLCTCMPA